MSSSGVWQDSPYLVPLCIAATIAVGIAIFAWRRRHAPGAYALAALMLSVGVWSFGYAAELSSAGQQLALIWAKVEYLGIAAAPVLWLVFILQYTGRRQRLTWHHIGGLCVIPLLTVGLTWTNERHGLIWSAVAWDTSGPFGVLDVRHGAWFWIHTAYSYSMLLFGTIVLARALCCAPHLYRGQAITMLLGASTPWLANAIYLSGLNPLPGLDLTPLAFTITGLAFVRSFLRFRLLDIVPVARDAVVESMSDGVLVLDLHNRIVDLNPAARRATGQTSVEAIGQHVDQVFAAWPDMIERYSTAIDMSEEVVLGEDQAQRTFDLRISPIYNRRGRLSGRLVVWRDISDRKRTEAAAKRRAQELELIDQVRIALGQAGSLPDLFRAVVERIAATFGYTLVSLYMLDEDELRLQHQVGYTSVIATIPITRGVMGQAVRTAEPILLADARANPAFLGAIEGVESEICVPLFDHGRVVGTLNVESIQGVRLTDDDLRLLLVLGQSISEAIERTRLYDELVSSEQRFRTLVANVPGAIYRCADDSSRSEEFISDAISTISGYPPGDFIASQARTFTSIIHREDRERVREEVASQDSFVLEYRIVHADGSIRWVRDLGQRIFGPNGDTRWLDGVIFDVTERKRVEEALAEAKDAAEAASRAKSAFLANMSHELRTPLTAIMGYSQLLRLEAQTLGYDKLIPDLDRITVAGRHLLALISDILDFSKIEAGKLVLVVEPFDLPALMREVAATVQPLIDRNGNRLILHCDDRIGPMLSDRTKVQQVLLNLLGNAAKFTQHGTITLHATGIPPLLIADAPEADAVTSRGSAVVLQVQDTGIGMTSEQIQQLFQPFTQVDTTAMRAYGGTGLGLALSQRLCQIMGGEISVASQPGAGSIFTVCLPMVAAQPTARPSMLADEWESTAA